MYNTIQCEAVLKILCKSKEHLSADEIYNLLIKEISQLSLATVYRNLKKLEAMGLIKEITTLKQQKKFESNLSSHFHIHCPLCGKVTDLNFESLAEIDKILLAKIKDLNCDGYQLEILAKCADCSEKSASWKTKDKPLPLSLI